MTGRELGFLVLGFIVGVLVTTVYRFIHGYILWSRREKPVMAISLDEMKAKDGITLRIEKDEFGNPKIVPIVEERETHGEDDLHCATNECDDD